MATPRMRVLAALLTVLALDGCAGRVAPRHPLVGVAARRAVRVDNESRDRIDVYLVAETREWYLGRLAPGATAWLALPTRAEAGRAGMRRLAIIVGAPRSLRPSREAHAVTTLKQPIHVLLAQRWVFAQGQLTGLRLQGSGARRPRPPRARRRGAGRAVTEASRPAAGSASRRRPSAASRGRRAWSAACPCRGGRRRARS